MVTIPKVSDFEVAIVDGIKKRVCLKCGEPKDGRGILSHWASCLGDLDPGENNSEDDDGMKDSDVEKKINDGSEKMKGELLEETDKRFKEISKAFSERFDGLTESLDKLVKGKGKGKGKDEEDGDLDLDDDDDDEDGDDGKGTDLAKGGDDLDFTKADYAVIGMVIAVLIIMIAIVMYYTKEGESKTKSESKKELTSET